MPLPVGGRNEDLQKLYQSGLFGDQRDPKNGRRFWRGLAIDVTTRGPRVGFCGWWFGPGKQAREAACGYGDLFFENLVVVSEALRDLRRSDLT